MEFIEVQGTRVPALGFGTAGLRGDTCVESVKDAIAAGYRQIDTARMYRNEAEVGKGIAASGVARDEIFLTTKLMGADLAGNNVGPATDDSLKSLGLDYIDLLLIHAPSQDVPLEETLTAMAEQKKAGKVKHLGVSNFRAAMLKEAMGITEILANQVPYHPGRTQRTLCEVAKSEGVVITAYSPLARGRNTSDGTLEEIGKAHGKTAAQVALRWLLQQANVSPIPRSSSPEHRRSNLDVFDFELRDDEMARVYAMAEASG